MKKIIKWIVISVVSAVLVGCGGGGSSDSGGGSGGVVFSGPLNLSANGARESGTVTITVTEEIVTVSDGGSSGSAPLSSDGSQFAVPVGINNFENVCSEPVIFSGNINGSNIEGTISGSPTCTILGVTSVVNFSGTFSATTATSARTTINSTAETALQNSF